MILINIAETSVCDTGRTVGEYYRGTGETSLDNLLYNEVSSEEISDTPYFWLQEGSGQSELLGGSQNPSKIAEQFNEGFSNFPVNIQSVSFIIRHTGSKPSNSGLLSAYIFNNSASVQITQTGSTYDVRNLKGYYQHITFTFPPGQNVIDSPGYSVGLILTDHSGSNIEVEMYDGTQSNTRALYAVENRWSQRERAFSGNVLKAMVVSTEDIPQTDQELVQIVHVSTGIIAYEGYLTSENIQQHVNDPNYKVNFLGRVEPEPEPITLPSVYGGQYVPDSVPVPFTPMVVESTTQVTEPPITEPPITEPPITEPPITEPPITEPPITEPPITEPPITEPVKPGIFNTNILVGLLAGGVFVIPILDNLLKTKKKGRR